MIRFIIKNKFMDRNTGLRTESVRTVTCDVTELENILKQGGFSDDGYDINELFGCEIIELTGDNQ